MLPQSTNTDKGNNMLPCEQGENIRFIRESLSSVNENQRQMLELMLSISGQTSRIEHLEEASREAKTSLNEAFTRMRKMEMALVQLDPESIGETKTSVENMQRYASIGTNTYVISGGAALVAMVLAGSLIDLAFHRDILDKTIQFFKLGGQ